MEFLFIHKIIVSIIDAVAIGLGWIVYSHNPKGKINRIFFLMSVLMIGWVTFAYLGRFFAVSSPLLALLALKIAWFMTPLFFCGLYVLVLSLTGILIKHPFLNLSVVFVGIFVSLLSLFSSVIINSSRITDGALEIIYGKGIWLFLGYGVFLIFSTIYFLFKSYPLLSRQVKLRIQYLSIGLVFFYLFNILFNIIFPIFLRKTDLYYLGDYSTIIFLGFSGYAIVKKELFGIRLILTEFLVGSTSILLFINFLVSQSIFEYFWKGILFITFLVLGYLTIKSVIREIEQRREIEKLSKAKSEFISIASHQLRTPLAAIKGYISMILEGTYGEVSRRIKAPMKKVYASNERLIALVNNLLSISRIESGKIGFNPEESSIEDLINQVVDIFRIEARKKKLYLKFKKPAYPLPKVMVDREKMIDVFSNVVSNCIKYTLKGGITIKAEQIKDKINKIRITISDTGEGMTEEELSKMFQSFSRGMAGTKLYTEGAGLGLYVARKYMEMHKGKIWAESPGKGKGSTFYIELPVKEV